MIEQAMHKVLNTSLIIVAWVFYQLSELTGGIINQAFDQLFSLGLLALAVYFLWKDNKESRDYNRRRDERIEDLVASNTDALNKFTNTLEKLLDNE